MLLVAATNTRLRQRQLGKKYQQSCLEQMVRIFQKQSPGSVLTKRCSKELQQVYGRIHMLSAISAKLHITFSCSLANLLLILRTPFHKNNLSDLWKNLSKTAIFNNITIQY